MKYKGITIIKRNNSNSWQARYRKNGKQFSVSATTQIDCYNKLKKSLNKIIKQEKQKERKKEEPKQKTYTLIEWYNIWFNTYKKGKIKETTELDYKASLKYFKNLFYKKINELKNIDITQTLNLIPYERRKQKVYEILNDMLNKAIKNDLITKNPIIDERPKHKRINGISLTITDEELFEKIKQQEKYKIFVLCLYQGLRKGEVLALTKQDFNIKEKTLTINKSLNIFNKIDTTKNETSNRIIPLFNNTIELVKDILNNKKDNERVFEIANPTAGRLFSELKQEYKLNEKYTIHSLRHTFVTKCQEKNIPLHIIQQWVGHTIGSKVTNSVYTHFRADTEKEYISRLEN